MRRVGLGVLFVAWLYGVPFLLIIGLIRRTSRPFMATRAAALAFGATTDTMLTAALVLNLALPVAGVLLARLVRDAYWTHHFVGSLVGMAVIYIAVLIAASAATTPLIGWTPADHGPTPSITRCVPISGGHGCPGG